MPRDRNVLPKTLNKNLKLLNQDLKNIVMAFWSNFFFSFYIYLEEREIFLDHTDIIIIEGNQIVYRSGHLDFESK